MLLDCMQVFVAIADTGTITGAAEKLGLTKSTVSRRLAAYEHQIGTTLFRRSTRSISLTDEGKTHYLRVRETIYDAEMAITEITANDPDPSGLLRLSASLVIGQRVLAPMIWQFMAKYPKVKVDLFLTDNIVDMVKDGVDFAVRMGELQDSELLVRQLGKGHKVIVASPALLGKYFVPREISQLKKLPAVVSEPNQHIWRFASGASVSVNWICSAGTIPLVLDACLKDIGIALLPQNMCAPYLANGNLVQLMPSELLPTTNISLVYPRLEHQSSAARVFLDEMRNREQFIV